jgi:flagellar hook-associated protein FlgK
VIKVNKSKIEKSDKIYVAGHRGLVGSAIVRGLKRQGYQNIVGRTHKELELTEQAQVRDFFEKEKPDVVVLAAAKVGGINANNTAPCNFEGYYERMIVELSSKGSVYNTLATNLTSEVSSIDNNRQQVIGVSSDEELTNMIKYQNAYNAASRYINVVSEMLEHLVTRL